MDEISLFIVKKNDNDSYFNCSMFSFDNKFVIKIESFYKKGGMRFSILVFNVVCRFGLKKVFEM